MSEPTVESCRALGHSPRFISRVYPPTTRGFEPCWPCYSSWRRANCDHAEHPAIPYWAGALGWRYSCAACGARVAEPAS